MLLFLLMIADENDRGKIIWLYETYHIKMLKYARYLLRTFGDENYLYDSEDITSEAYMKIMRYLNNIDFSLPEEAIGGYLFTVVEHEVYRFLSKTKGTEELDEVLTICEECDFLEELYKKDMYSKAKKAIKSLDAKYSTVLWMRFVDGMSVEQIADVLSLSDKAVYTRIYRGLKKVKKQFGVNE